MAHSKGNWKIGNTGGCVISDEIPEDMKGTSTGHTEVEFYGGYLICESVYRNDDAKLIAAAPEMLSALEDLENDNGHIPKSIWDNIQSIISKVKS